MGHITYDDSNKYIQPIPQESHLHHKKKKILKNMSFLQLNFLTSKHKATNYGTNEEIAVPRTDTHLPVEKPEPAGGAQV